WSPPTVSTTPCTGPSTVAGSGTTSAAPRAISSARRRSTLRVAATGTAPASRSSCTANRPTPPVAPVTSTRRPRTSPRRRIARRALAPAIPTVLAAPRSAPSESGAIRCAGTARNSAHPPPTPSVRTGVPSRGPEPSRAARTTTPAASQPGTVPACGGVSPPWISPKLTVNASTCTSASPSAGLGSGTSDSVNAPRPFPDTTARTIGPYSVSIVIDVPTIHASTVGGRRSRSAVDGTPVRRTALAIEDVAPVVQHVAVELAVGAEPGVVAVLDTFARDPVSTGVGALPSATCLVVATVGQQLLPDVPICGDPHPHVGMPGVRPRRVVGCRSLEC